MQKVGRNILSVRLFFLVFTGWSSVSDMEGLAKASHRASIPIAVPSNPSHPEHILRPGTALAQAWEGLGPFHLQAGPESSSPSFGAETFGV